MHTFFRMLLSHKCLLLSHYSFHISITATSVSTTIELRPDKKGTRKLTIFIYIMFHIFSLLRQAALFSVSTDTLSNRNVNRPPIVFGPRLEPTNRPPIVSGPRWRPHHNHRHFRRNPWFRGPYEYFWSLFLITPNKSRSHYTPFGEGVLPCWS